MADFFGTSIEFLKGVGPERAEWLQKELGIFTYDDLLTHFPFRYEDRTRFYKIGELTDTLPHIQFIGTIRKIDVLGQGRKRRLVVIIGDETGEIELIWFKAIDWVLKKLVPYKAYVVFGKAQRYGKKINFAHPEIEPATEKNTSVAYLQPVYPTTEKLRAKFLDSKGISKLLKLLLVKALPEMKETLSAELIEWHGLISGKEAFVHVHFPENDRWLQKARYRLKFEELFFIQLNLLLTKGAREEKLKGQVFQDIHHLNEFYHKHLPFELTGAQKRVIREVYQNMKVGHQMNRLLQGDVGSGKTMVAFICMLIAISNDTQAVMMAPTEILAEQHMEGLSVYAEAMGLRVALLTGSTKTAQRKHLLTLLRQGDIHILVGTHALIEDRVQFKNLGLAVIDEQHRFGVAQRAKLWQKNKGMPPHVLVMTATPIPRTLAMTLYGDLDLSVIDELPAGRKPIETRHYYDNHRLKVFGFIRKQVALGRQVYIVYPLIEESKLELKNLEDGYESVTRAFPDLGISLLHGRMKSEDKDFEMKRFVKGETKLMVSTTVIEVGVNVPNASVMIIENAERFGLAQLHQLRGRVGRGAEQSYCFLMTSHKLTADGRQRIETMVRTNNGFEIADVDLQLRGPGDLLGTQQSGILDLRIADLATDGKILQAARQAAQELLDKDPELKNSENAPVRAALNQKNRHRMDWSQIS